MSFASLKSCWERNTGCCEGILTLRMLIHRQFLFERGGWVGIIEDHKIIKEPSLRI